MIRADSVHSTPPVTASREPRRLGYEAEFLDLMEQRRRIEIRLDELVELIDPGVPHRSVTTALPNRLRLVVSRPGAALFKGGRGHG